MFRATPPIDGREAGFTIIEVLIALVVVAISIAAIGSLMSTNVRGVRKLEQHVMLMQTLRSVIAADLPSHSQIAFGTSSGQTNGHRWRIDIGPMSGQAKASGDQPEWIPALVRVQVRSPSGAVMDVRTVRLMRGQKP